MPRYMENLIAAAARTGARLVVLDNLYLLGRPAGRALDEETPPNPCSKKGAIRARAAERLFEAHRRGDVRATTGRASDFYGPGGTLTSELGNFFWPRALGGKTAWVFGDPDTIHTYHYIPDVAAGLATLGGADDAAYGRPWMLPCAPAESTRSGLRPDDGVGAGGEREREGARRDAPGPGETCVPIVTERDRTNGTVSQVPLVYGV